MTVGISPAFGLYPGWARDVFHCEACSGREAVVASGVDGPFAGCQPRTDFRCFSFDLALQILLR